MGDNKQNQHTVPYQLLTISLLVVLSPELIAQGKRTLEEVVVTAQKRAESLQDVPATVDALSEGLMEKTLTSTFKDLQNITSGVQFGGAPRDGFQSTIKIRGVGAEKNQSRVDPRVGIFVNDIPYAKRAQAFANLADVEQVEVLKGPHATLFGKSVTSGAITIATKRPSVDEWAGFFDAKVGSQELTEFATGGNLPVSDTFAIRASIYYEEEDGFVTNVRSDRKDPEFEGWGGRLRFLYEPSINFNAILGFEYNETETHGDPVFKVEGGDLHFQLEEISGQQFPLFEAEDRKRTGVTRGRGTTGELISLHLNYKFTEKWELSSISGYQNWDLDVDKTKETEIPTESQVVKNLVERTGTSDGLPRVPGGFSDVSFQPELLHPFFTRQGALSRTQEIRFSYESEKWSSIYGVFYSDSEKTGVSPILLTLGFLQSPEGGGLATMLPGAGPQLVLALVVDNRELVEDTAVFTHHTYSATPKLELTFGLRYAEIDKTSNSWTPLGRGPFEPIQNTEALVTPTAGGPPERTESWSDFSGTAKLNYRLRDRLSTYIGYSRAFKPGGFNPAQNSSFDEETVEALEVGIKGQFLNRTMRWNAAVFKQLFEDFQVRTTTPNGINAVTDNAAKVDIEGVEMEVEWQTTPQWNIKFNLSYVNARYDDFKNATCARPQFGRAVCEPGPPAIMGGAPANFTRDLSGKRLSTVSPWTTNLFITWNDALWGTGWNYYVRGEHNFRDDILFQTDLDPALSESAYGLFNASVGIVSPNEKYQVVLWAKNMTDEVFRIDATRSRDFTQAALPPGAQPPERFEGYRARAGEKRRFGLSFKYHLTGNR